MVRATSLRQRTWFYLFSLAGLVAIKNGCCCLLFLSAALAGAVYWVAGRHRARQAAARRSRAASSRLGAARPVLRGKACGPHARSLLLLYSDNGVVVGAGATTDLLSGCRYCGAWPGLAPPGAIARGDRAGGGRALPRGGAAAVRQLDVVAGCSPRVFNRFSDEPSELQLETPHIERQHRLDCGRPTTAADRGDESRSRPRGTAELR